MASVGYQESGYRYADSLKLIERNLMDRKMMNQLGDIISKIKVPGPYERTTRLYRKLVEKLKPQIRFFEKDPEIRDLTAKKLAKFIEGVMREACMLEKSKTFIATRQSSSTSDRVMLEINKLQSRTKRPIYLKKISKSSANCIPRTGPIYTATVGGQRLYIEDVFRDDCKALITMPNSYDKTDQWSFWLIDIQAETSDWVRWLDDEALAFEKRPRDSISEASSRISQSELRNRRLFFDTPSTEKFWGTSSVERLTSSQSASSVDLNISMQRPRTSVMASRASKKRLHAPDVSISPTRPKTAVNRRVESPVRLRQKSNKNTDLRVLYGPTVNRKKDRNSFCD